MEIVLLSEEMAQAYWELRLKALRDSPLAFSSSYEEALQKPNPIDDIIRNLRQEGIYTHIALSDDTLIGSVTLVHEQGVKLNHTANIYAMYVDRAYRNIGVGRALVMAALQKAKEIDGLKTIKLSVTSQNTPAKMLYQNLGFKKYGHEEKALKVNGAYYDEELMILFL
ncbi:MAG: GNAT family N-acetyltransferase [Bacillus sp. (in: firmicutes)]